MDGLEAAQKMYGGPPRAKATGDGAATKPPAPPKEAADAYREDLHRRVGGSEAGGVPEREIEAFEAVFRVAREHAACPETMRVALRAGAAEGQRRNALSRANTAGGGRAER